MPQIEAIVKVTATGALLALDEYRADVCGALAEVSGYKPEDIALIPRILSTQEERLSHNLLDLHFVLDLGVRPALGLNDETAERFNDLLDKHCPAFRPIHFTSWLRQHKINGHAEHKPKT